MEIYNSVKDPMPIMGVGIVPDNWLLSKRLKISIHFFFFEEEDDDDDK